MPVMGGDELVPILEQEYPSLKIVVTNGYHEGEARKEFLRFG
jgi:YesN/AraC family two-component response regulator